MPSEELSPSGSSGVPLFGHVARPVWQRPQRRHDRSSTPLTLLTAAHKARAPSGASGCLASPPCSRPCSSSPRCKLQPRSLLRMPARCGRPTRVREACGRRRPSQRVLRHAPPAGTRGTRRRAAPCFPPSRRLCWLRTARQTGLASERCGLGSRAVPLRPVLRATGTGAAEAWSREAVPVPIRGPCKSTRPEPRSVWQRPPVDSGRCRPLQVRARAGAASTDCRHLGVRFVEEATGQEERGSWNRAAAGMVSVWLAVALAGTAVL